MAGSSTDLFVTDAITAFLDERGIGHGPVRHRPLGDGHSNLTYLVERDDVRVVLRRPPRPPLPPSAHDMVRESAIVGRLYAAGARVPEVLAVCEDPGLLGVPFYVMELAPGVPVDRELPPAIDAPDERARLGDEFVDVLAEIHAIDPEAAGLASFGRPDGYLERQVARFLKIWPHNQTRDLPAVEEVAAWLAAHVPPAVPATVVHGDYRVGNLLVAKDAPARISAVLDWELSTIGDPLADLGYLLSMYVDDTEPAPGYPGLSPVTRQEGFPSRGQLADRYAARTGRDTSRIAWYECLAHWKAAVFLENMWKRFLAGDRDDEFARAMEAGVPAKLAAAEAAAARDDAAR
jgi:aminoglycoside phosphotransferase (APT) family kinase protein